MNKKKQELIFNKIVEDIRTMILNKGDDYANEDRLSNFKLAGKVIGSSPQMNCLNLIATKVARLGVLINYKTEKPKNESINDSLLDLAAYAMLLIMINDEETY